MAEATSKHAVPTLGGRGTASYRAPELLNESPVYTRKVDIWALGCILFELSTTKKAFRGDWHVREYAVAKQTLQFDPIIPLAKGWPFPTYECIHDLLQLDWSQRPKASFILHRVRSYQKLSVRFDYGWEFFHQLANLYRGERDSDREQIVRRMVMPLFVKDIDEKCRTKVDAFDALSCWAALSCSYPSSMFKNARRLSIKRRFSNQTESTPEFQDDWSYQEHSSNLYNKLDGEDSTIAAWKGFVCQNPNDVELQHRLEIAYHNKGDHRLAIAGGWDSLTVTLTKMTCK